MVTSTTNLLYLPPLHIMPNWLTYRFLALAPVSYLVYTRVANNPNSASPEAEAAVEHPAV